MVFLWSLEEIVIKCMYFIILYRIGNDYYICILIIIYEFLVYIFIV